MSPMLAVPWAGYDAFGAGNMDEMLFLRIIVDQVSNANSLISKHSP
jgi:hypothetical protein